MASYQLSNTASEINNFISGYIHKDSENTFSLSKFSFIGAGSGNNIINPNTSLNSFIGAGKLNTGNGLDTVICGGWKNSISGNYSNIVGGQDNKIISGNHSFIGAGRFNTQSGEYSVIVGGNANTGNSAYSFIGGGERHIISGQYGSILGGRKALIMSGHSGAAVLADGQDRNHFSKGTQTCSLDFASGVYLRLPTFAGANNQAGNPGELKVSGQFLYVATGTNTWGRVQISSFT